MEYGTATIQPEEEFFLEDLLAQAAAAPSDEQVQTALESRVQEIVASGDMLRIRTAAMALGATACTHPHLENLANVLGEHVMGDGHGHHNDHKQEKGDHARSKKRGAMRFGLPVEVWEEIWAPKKSDFDLAA